jgi:hypothetical protein
MDYGLATISVTKYVERLTLLKNLEEYNTFVDTVKHVLTGATNEKHYQLLINIDRESVGAPHGEGTYDLWGLSLKLYSATTHKGFYPLNPESTRETTLVAEYKDNTTFDVGDLGEDLANMPWYEVPALITLDIAETLRFLGGEPVGVSCSLIDIEIFKN